MDDKKTNIGQIIYDLRVERDVQQCELARAVGLHQSVLNRIEKGTRPARDAEIVALAKYFHVSCDYLLGMDAEGNVNAETQTIPIQPALSLRLKHAEEKFIHKLRLLDERGRRAVTDTLEREYEYINSTKEKALS